MERYIQSLRPVEADSLGPYIDSELLRVEQAFYDVQPRGYDLQTPSANYTSLVTEGEQVILASGTLTVTLPSAAENNAKITVKMLTAATTVTIDGSGAETIDGAASITLTTQYESRTLVPYGGNWFII